jgi:hypothetical protein
MSERRPDTLSGRIPLVAIPEIAAWLERHQLELREADRQEQTRKQAGAKAARAGRQRRA